MIKTALSAMLLMAMVSVVARGGDSPSRSFEFTYGGAVTGLKPRDSARVWLPAATTTPDQVVEIVERAPGKLLSTQSADGEGNAFLYFEEKATSDGTVPFSVVYRVTRHAVIEGPASVRTDDSRYLKPDALVPVKGKAASVLLAGRKLSAEQFQTGRLLFDLVDDHMQYRKDRPGWGRGDANWACDSGFGNCTDFHSLFASLARSVEIPVKMEFGFQIPDKRGKGAVAGYHCWAKFRADGHGWVPVDISRANQDPSRRDYYFGHLDENRVMFSTGRDLELVPRQAGPPVNFLVYPYVEVNGTPYPQEQVMHDFAYADTNGSESVGTRADGAGQGHE